MEAYLDNSATTKCAREVVETVVKAMQDDYGNPSSKHMKGVDAEQYIKQAAATIARSLKCQEKELVFTSGGTESNNMAIIGTAMANKRRGNHVIVSSVEHSSVKEPFNFLEEQGFRVTYLPVDAQGRVSIDALREALDSETILVSVMYANNEIGTVEPVEEIGQIVKQFNPAIVYHVDAIQAYGKFKIVPKKLNIDLLSVSGHKIHGPKGTGFLYVKEKTKIKPIILGGGQQKAMRSGTENVPGIAGLGVAAGLIYNSAFDEKINLERSMRPDALLDGHIVQGHVDQTARCTAIDEADGSWYFAFEYDPSQGNVTVEKGSVAVNGVSLTVVDSREGAFRVAIIPYTYEHTNFHALKVGSTVNLEFDIVGKYIARLMERYVKA